MSTRPAKDQEKYQNHGVKYFPSMILSKYIGLPIDTLNDITVFEHLKICINYGTSN